MKLDVPFYVQEDGNKDCGPIALKMVFSYFEKDHDIDKIKELISSEASGYTWTIGLAKAAAQLGFRTEFYSTSLELNEENFDMDFYQKETGGKENSEIKLQRLINDCGRFNVKLEEKSLSLEEIIEKINENCVPVILLDWHKIRNKGGYQGHFAPIVGYDEKNIYVHNPGPLNPEAYFAIEKSKFDEARKAKGTDEDIVFIYRR